MMNPTNITNGLVHVYTGSGKGKTTAALGVALRALGWGAKVCMVQFIKGYSEIGEAKMALEFPGRFVIKQFAVDLVRHINEKKVHKTHEAVKSAMEYAVQAVLGGDFDLVILDEINNALHYNLIKTAEVLELIERKPSHVELILTGRNAPAEIIEAADYVTEMKLIKHPYEQGIQARKIIDY